MPANLRLLPLLLLLCTALGSGDAAAQSMPDQAPQAPARSDDVDLATFALERGANIEVRDPLGSTPLQVTAMFGSPQVTELLLAHGADPAAATPDNRWTALHYAAWDGHDRVAELLIAAGAPIDARETDHGNTAPMLAANRARLEEVKLLLKAGANVRLKAKDGWNALAAAEMIGNAEIAGLLRAAGAAG